MTGNPQPIPTANQRDLLARLAAGETLPDSYTIHAMLRVMAEHGWVSSARYIDPPHTEWRITDAGRAVLEEATK